MTKFWHSMMRKVRRTLGAIKKKSLYCECEKDRANRYAFYSKQPQVLQIDLRPHRHCPPLDWHQRPSLLLAVLVLQKTALLDTEGLGAGLCGVVACIPKSTDWECEYPDMGDCLRDYRAACWSRSCGGAGLGTGTAGREAEGEDGCRSRRWSGRRKERALAAGRYCNVYGLEWQLEDISKHQSRNTHHEYVSHKY